MIDLVVSSNKPKTDPKLDHPPPQTCFSKRIFHNDHNTDLRKGQKASSSMVAMIMIQFLVLVREIFMILASPQALKLGGTLGIKGTVGNKKGFNN